MRQSLAIHAPAKLNLALSVGTPNAQGMHPICSWMVTVNLFDDLLVTRLEDDRLSRYAILWHADAKRRQSLIRCDEMIRAAVTRAVQTVDDCTLVGLRFEESQAHPETLRLAA